MSLSTEIAAVRPRRKGEPCGVRRIGEALSAVERAELDDALANKTILGSQIGEALRGRGFQIQDQTITRHRRGDCTCELG